MTDISLANLQKGIREGPSFKTLNDYATHCLAFLQFLEKEPPTRIVSPSHPNYIFISITRNMATGSPDLSTPICLLNQQVISSRYLSALWPFSLNLRVIRK